MISMFRSVCSAIPADASRSVSSLPRNRSWLGALCAVLAVLLCGAGSIASAQTAHFSSAQTTIGSGFYYPASTAVDNSGNVYVADYGNHAVKEIMAVNGSIPASPTIKTLPFGHFQYPAGVAVDGSGNLYVADSGLGAVIEILAVNGSIPTSPNIIPLGSGFTAPISVAVDSMGDVFVADYGNPQSGVSGSLKEILAVNGSIPASPTIVALAPNPIPGDNLFTPGGIALDSQGDLYFVVTTPEVFVSASMASNQSASGSNSVTGCSGNVISNSFNAGSVYELHAVNGSIPAAPLVQLLSSGIPINSNCSYPNWVAVDSSGNVYVTDDTYTATSQMGYGVGINSVYEILAVNGSIPASPTINVLASNFSDPMGVTVNGSGSLYVANMTKSQIVEQFVSSVNFGTENIGVTTPVIPMTFTFDTAGTLGSMAVLTQGATGLDFANAGAGTCKANAAYFIGQTCTVNVTFTPGFAGTRYGAAVLYDSTGNAIATGNLQGTGVGPQVNFLPAVQSVLGSGFDSPISVAVDGSGDIIVADTFHSAVKELIAVNGVIPASPTIRTLGSGFNTPEGVSVDGSGNVYVADSGNSTVKEILAVNGGIPASPMILALGSGFNYPMGVAVDGNGNVYVADSGNSAIKEILAVNGSIPVSPTIRTLASGFIYPRSVAVDGSGNVYACENINSVQEILAVDGSIPTTPTIVTLASGFTHDLSGVAVDGRGNLYLTDWYTSEVFEIPAVNGSIPSSPNVLTIATGLSYPYDVAVDSSGNIYVPNWGNSEMVKLDFADPPSLSFASTAPASTSTDSPQTVTVENVGNAALTFPVPSSGYNPSTATNFSLNDNGASACPVIGAGFSGPGTLAAGATCQLLISFSPTAASALSGSLILTDNNLNAAAPGYTTQSITLSGTGLQATPTITWTTPAAITFGTALSGGQLNASSTIAGSFTYSPVAGTVLTAGAQTLAVTFTPTDTTDYTTATATVILNVNQAVPAITWASPAAITYGTALSATQLNASSTVAGSYTYSSVAGTVLTAGTQTLAVTFTPTDSTDYTTASATVTLTVNKATPAITWATPVAITYGTALSVAQLDASSTVAGSFSYSPAAGTVLTAGAQTLTVTFTPTDTTDYTTATASVTLTVNMATPILTCATPAPIVYGTPISSATFGCSANVPGTFVYSPAVGTVLTAGSNTLSIIFTPTDTTDYTTAAATVTLIVNKATPTMTWATPAAITYGTALSGTQLDATANVSGTFAYNPTAGTVPAVGTDTLTVTFTPTNTTDYTMATASVVLKVNPAPTFALSASPASLTVAQGASGKSTITVTDQNGFTGKVILAASGLPSGVTAAFATNPTTGTSVLTLTASTTAAVGTATVTIIGTSGSLTANTTIALTISCTPTTIVPYIYVNGAWKEESSVTVSSPTTMVDLGPQPTSSGSWSWTGPNEYTSTSRQINGIPLTVGTDSFVATYINASGCKSTETFMITVK